MRALKQEIGPLRVTAENLQEMVKTVGETRLPSLSELKNFRPIAVNGWVAARRYSSPARVLAVYLLPELCRISATDLAQRRDVPVADLRQKGLVVIANNCEGYDV